MTIARDKLRMITEGIRSVLDPALIVLFGSQGRGTAGRNSDIDLLVVGERPATGRWSRRRTVGSIRRNLPDLGVPVDILFYTPDEVKRWKDTTNHVVSEALAEGQVLYERS